MKLLVNSSSKALFPKVEAGYLKFLKKNSILRILFKLFSDFTPLKVFNRASIWPEEIEGEIIFNSPDLATSIHGIRKIEYNSVLKGENTYQVELVLFDVYDFQKANLPSLLMHPIQYLVKTVNNAIDIGEEIGVIHNFEIEIHITDTIYVS